MIGQTISHYKITDKLGEGGMGVVYKAEDTKLERTVALKFLAAHLVEDEEGRGRFLREAKAAAALDHPNICTVYEIDEAGGQTFLAMASIDGQSLKEKIGGRPLKLDEALDLALQTARGLQAAHKKGVVHRDIKPANLMLTEEGQVKIMDFGLAQLADRTKLTKTGTSLGTPASLSPEQSLGQKVDRRSDIWSLGVVLYEMVTGQLPFKGDVEAALAYSIVNEDPEPLTGLRSGLPIELDRIAGKTLAKDPGDRYQHVDELLVDLRSLRREMESGGGRGISATAGPPSRRPVSATQAVAALSIAVVAAGLTWWLARSGDRVRPAQPLALTRLTSDPGLSFHPAISADGEFVAYASDRAGGNNLDIWVQQIGGSEPIRLTSDPADEIMPTFSPDGRTIAFRSYRTPGGVYSVSTLGGTERLIAPGGTFPSFSPDGTQLAYAVFGNGFRFRLFIIPATGGEPRQLAPDFIQARRPVWSPDGQYIYFKGRSAGSGPEAADLFRVSVEGGSPTPTEYWELAEAAGIDFNLGLYDSPFTFLDSATLLLSGRIGNNQNLWEVRIDPASGRAISQTRKTFGTAIEQDPSASSSGRIVFSSLALNTDVWSLPFDSLRAEALGEPERVTSDLGVDHSPSVSWNGEKVVFTSDRSGNRDIWVKDLTTGRLAALTATPQDEARGIMSPDGTQVAFSRRGADGIYLTSTAGGLPRKLCDDCGPRALVNHWLRDGTKLLYYSRAPGGGPGPRYYTLDVRSGEHTEILRKRWRAGAVNIPEISPDGRWVAFSMSAGEGSPIFITALGDDEQAESSPWIQITDGSQFDFKPFWSPNGNWVYFATGGQGSLQGLRGQRLNPETKHPIGEPKTIHALFGGRYAGTRLLGGYGMSLARDQVVFSRRETTGNIWLAEP